MTGAIVLGSEVLAMTSREIAELTGKEHGNVMRDIRAMLEAISTDSNLNPCANSSSYTGKDGRQYPQYELDKNTCLTLLLGYDPVARMKVVKRWQELEAKQLSAIPDFSDPAAAARAWADAYEKNRALALERDHAIATKAEIGTRREATAMNTASQAVKRANALEIELDKSKDYATVKRMQMLYHGASFDWRLLKNTGNAMGVAAIDVFDQNYGTVKAYHASVWREAYALGIDGEVV